MAVTEHLTIGPVSVQLSADARGGTVVEDVRRYLFADRGPAASAPHLRIHVEAGPHADGTPDGPPDGVQTLGVFDNGFVLWEEKGRLVLGGGQCMARLDVAGGEGTVQVADDVPGSSYRWVSCAVVLQSLSILLHRHGLFSMHAAALVRHGRGLVLAASADSGKSTLALRLVQSGWSYLSDDTILLRLTPSDVEVLGLRSHFSLDPEAEALFPGLATGREAALLKDEKWAVNVEALHPERRAEACRPEVLVFPRIVDAAESRLARVSKTDAFGALLAQSSMAQVRLDHTAAHLDALARLAGHTRAYRLLAGRDLLDDPARADTLLAPLLEPTFALD